LTHLHHILSGRNSSKRFSDFRRLATFRRKMGLPEADRRRIG
jgi:hypothetical protein